LPGAARRGRTLRAFVGTCEFGNGTTTVHGQIAASVLATTVDRGAHPPVRHRSWSARHRRLWQHGHGRGGAATRAAAALAEDPRFRRRSVWRRSTGDCRLADDHVVVARVPSPSPNWPPRSPRRAPLERAGHSAGTPRSVAFNVQGFEVAVHRRYGEIRILRSIHAADAGAVINPMQCRGQVEGGVAQALGAALTRS
jgi:putative selenate reductase molybdopterin-binding subunit